jgi:hypothetical protein
VLLCIPAIDLNHTCPRAPDIPPAIIRSNGEILSGRDVTKRLMVSWVTSLIAVSGAIFSTFAPLPLKYARMLPGTHSLMQGHFKEVGSSESETDLLLLFS